ALNPKQISDLHLHPQMKVKKSSSRSKGFIRKFGSDVFELEAVPPAQLEDILRNTIHSVLDLKLYEAEIERAKKDAALLDAARAASREQLANSKFFQEDWDEDEDDWNDDD